MTPLDSDVELAPMRLNPYYQMPYKPTFAEPTKHLALARASIHVMHFPSFWADLKHSTTKHLEFKSTGVEIEPELDQLLKTKPLLSRENIEDMMQCLPPLIEKISKLCSFDGWACTLDDCPYISRDADKTKHCNEVHNSKFYQGIQWTVKLGNSFLKFLQSTQDDPIFEAQLKLSLVPVRVQGYSLPHLTSLVRLPKLKSNNPLLQIIPIARTWIASLDDLIHNVNPVHLICLAEGLPQIRNRKRMFCLIGPLSHDSYARFAVVFALCAMSRDSEAGSSKVHLDPIAPDWDFIDQNNIEVNRQVAQKARAGSMPNDEVEQDSDSDSVDDCDKESDSDSDSDDDNNDVENPNSAEEEQEAYDSTALSSGSAGKKIYPIFFTVMQKSATLKLWEVLKNDWFHH
ncbi:hypothetical protein FB451DRAFT_1193843 [Mycena latifolia]|nr:hypothetical protein FB451DRAFT_1193843 [Mycena latifolia]